VQAYLDDVLVAIKGSYKEHLLSSEKSFEKLNTAELCIFEYVGYLVTTAGIHPLPFKVEAILQLKAPKSMKQRSSFIGLVNYYHNVWKQRLHLLIPLTIVTKVSCGSKNFKWTEAQEKVFKVVKKVIPQNGLTYNPCL
jgi:hypothetical protein